MNQEKQLETLKKLKKEATEKFESCFNKIKNDFGRIPYFYELTYKSDVKVNILKYVILDIENGEQNVLLNWVRDEIHSFKYAPDLKEHTTNELINLESIWKNEVRLEMCGIFERIANKKDKL